jgi:imidazolonepropionase-like amidohydrolase
VEFGVRSIEHGTLIDDETAEFVAARGAYVVPTMATIFSLKEAGKRLGFPPESQEKMEVAYAAALEGMDRMRRAGVKLGFGTDLLGSLHVQECREFTIRSEVFSPLEILRQATSINAEMMQLEGKLGCVAPGAHADLLVVDGDPLADAGVLAADGKNLRVVVRAGEVVKDDRG